MAARTIRPRPRPKPRSNSLTSDGDVSGAVTDHDTGSDTASEKENIDSEEGLPRKRKQRAESVEICPSTSKRRRVQTDGGVEEFLRIARGEQTYREKDRHAREQREERIVRAIEDASRAQQRLQELVASYLGKN